jgi:hypothetical protein
MSQWSSSPGNSENGNELEAPETKVVEAEAADEAKDTG